MTIGHLHVHCALMATPSITRVDIRLTKTTTAQNDLALSYHSVRELYFLAVVFVGAVVIIYFDSCQSTCFAFETEQINHRKNEYEETSNLINLGYYSGCPLVIVLSKTTAAQNKIALSYH